ncbi:MAG TPA: GGDEF domain-containing protein [Steroidobacteraceae bacterium]|nr:GGDEF domain-containing protein [Steroidobacteraceae bacterium]
MRRLLFTAAIPGGAAAVLLRTALLALALCALAPRTARADCFPVSDPAYVTLDPLVDVNARQALSTVSARLEALSRTAGARDARQLAALYAVQADAYNILELDHQARAAAGKGLALVAGATDPLRLELLSTAALAIYTEDGIRDAIASIGAAQASQPQDSLSGLCLGITLGILQRRAGENALATRTLTRAYHDSETPERAEAHSGAAVELSSALRGVGDFQEALTLVREKIAWDDAHGDSLALSVSTYLEGEDLNAMRDFRGAIATFQRARSISVSLADTQGIAFANMRICQSLIELGRDQSALPRCDSAAHVFAASKSTDVLKQTQEYMAEIYLQAGHPRQALGLLDQVLDHDGTDMDANMVGIGYRTRAQARDALHHYRRAYLDLAEYLRRYRAENLARRMRLQETVRERFLAEREIARNAVLQRQLEVTRQRATRQTETLRWVAAAGTAGALVIALLSYILIINLRLRRQLLRLATEDNLTGMPNRGRTAALATAALEAAAAQNRPLTIAIIDLDHFKAINDRCGHATGDHVLREFARVSRGSLRDADVLGRWGGEEFLLILPGTTLDAALASIERLRVLALAIRVPYGEGEAPLRVTFSAGLATTADGARSLDEIIGRADAALYEAKNEGRDLVRIDRESYQTASTAVRRALRLR